MAILCYIIEKWCYFFKNANKTSEADLRKLIGSDLVIERAYEELNQFNWTEEELLTYEQETKRIMDNKAAEVVVRMSEITASSPKVSPSPASTDDTNVKPPSKQSTSNLSTPSRPNAFTLLMKKKTPIVDTVGKENSR